MSVPEISEGAIALLAVAVENDTKKRLCRNRAFITSLDFVRALPQILKLGGLSALAKRIGAAAHIDSLLLLCAFILDFIDRRVEDAKPEGNEWSAVSDFDHGVYLALAQTLSEVATSDRQKNIREPDLHDAIGRFAKAYPAELEERLVKNYLGNLLQDTFDACKVRLNVAGVPEDTEQKLREHDAALIAQTLISKVPRSGSAGVDLGNRLEIILRKAVAKEASS